MWQKLIRTNDDAAALVSRLALGGVIFPHGAQKLFGWFGGKGVSGTIEFFDQVLHVAPVLTFLVIMAESLGALALVIGLAGRFMAFSIGLVMLGAMYIVHFRWGFFMNWYAKPQGEGIEYHLLALGLVIAIMIKGSGQWSVDRILTQKFSK
ncbi:DoxX family protein [bacterium]|nr:DoxX family protein [bacterium]